MVKSKRSYIGKEVTVVIEEDNGYTTRYRGEIGARTSHGTEIQPDMQTPPRSNIIYFLRTNGDEIPLAMNRISFVEGMLVQKSEAVRRRAYMDVMRQRLLDLYTR
jgi:hypothetical protein